jgi:hypothetical protein
MLKLIPKLQQSLCGGGGRRKEFGGKRYWRESPLYYVITTQISVNMKPHFKAPYRWVNMNRLGYISLTYDNMNWLPVNHRCSNRE